MEEKMIKLVNYSAILLMTVSLTIFHCKKNNTTQITKPDKPTSQTSGKDIQVSESVNNTAEVYKLSEEQLKAHYKWLETHQLIEPSDLLSMPTEKQVAYINDLPETVRLGYVLEFMFNIEYDYPPKDSIMFLPDGRIIVVSNGYEIDEFSVSFWKYTPEQGLQIWKNNMEIGFPVDNFQIWTSVEATGMDLEPYDSIQFTYKYISDGISSEDFISRATSAIIGDFGGTKMKQKY